jgi:nucleotide-binding universal stress UspA family protein
MRTSHLLAANPPKEMTTKIERWQRVVAAVDDSITVDEVKLLFGAMRHIGSVTLANVVPVSYAVPVGMSRPDEYEGHASDAAARATLRMQQFEADKADFGSNSRIVERQGDLGVVLQELIRQFQPDLLIVGPRGAKVIEEIHPSSPVATLRPPCDVLVLADRGRGVKPRDGE